MEDHAREIVYWPGITNDIEYTCSIYRDRYRNALPQATLPAATPEIPTKPYEAIFADFFEEGGHHYLVTGDRLPGWVEVYSSRFYSSKAGSSALIAHLRSLFTTFGIPLDLSSDGDLNLLPIKQKSSCLAWVSTTRALLLIIPNQIAEQRLQ